MKKKKTIIEKPPEVIEPAIRSRVVECPECRGAQRQFCLCKGLGYVYAFERTEEP